MSTHAGIHRANVFARLAVVFGLLSGLPMTRLIITLTLAMGSVALAQTKDERVGAPYFAIDGDPLVDHLPLKKTSVHFAIVGSIADVTVKQTYENSGNRPIHAKYVFPASTAAAVQGMKMIIGARVIEAEIRERGQARQVFETAKQEGHRASLLEQERPNVFTMSVANIMPNDVIEVELHYSELLAPTANIYEFMYPTVVGPRYVGAEVPPNSSFTSAPYTHAGVLPETELFIEGTIAAPMPVLMPESSTHRIQVETPSGGAHVRLDPRESHGGNRDFVLHYRLAGDRVVTGLSLSQGPDENFFLLMVQPPKSVKLEQVPPRDYVFIVDVSGSMSGFPLETSKVLMHKLLGSLRPVDRFNVMLFSGSSQLLSPRSMLATPETVEKAIGSIDSMRGGGETELKRALMNAADLPSEEGIARCFVVITDGYVAAEQSIFKYIRENLGGESVFAIGIGSSVNRGLIEGIAHAGLGEPFIVMRPEEASAVSAHFIQYVQSPVLTDVKVQFDGLDAYDVEPSSIPTVFAERPVIVRGKWRGARRGTITLTGVGGTGAYSQTMSVAKTPIVSAEGGEALQALWARARLDDLSRSAFDEAPAITEIGLRYHLLTQYTSFVAVDKTVHAEVKEAADVEQKLPLPQGVSDLAVQGAEPSLWLLALCALAMLALARARA